jgi:hypothetical protein
LQTFDQVGKKVVKGKHKLYKSVSVTKKKMFCKFDARLGVVPPERGLPEEAKVIFQE